MNVKKMKNMYDRAENGQVCLFPLNSAYVYELDSRVGDEKVSHLPNSP